MAFPFQNCIVPPGDFSVPLACEMLQYQHGMACILIDLQSLEAEIQGMGGEKIAVRYLSSLEQEAFSRFSSGKRQREWLGGRFAARSAAAAVLGQCVNALPWSDLAVAADENGRPFLAAAKINTGLPDISISHSGNLAAAMAVSKGLCGLDLQKVGPRVVKVRERFCSTAEEHIVHSFFSAPHEKQDVILTKLWAAKEALRKVANTASLPGFLELELTAITENRSPGTFSHWLFTFIRQDLDTNGNPVPENCSVAVSLIADYALALTTRNDKVG